MATTAADLLKRLRAEGLDPAEWSNGPNDRYPGHEHGYDKVLVVTAGTIAFHLPVARNEVVLGVGDRLDLPAGTEHAALVGPAGVTCLEAHLPAGTLPVAAARRAAGIW